MNLRGKGSERLIEACRAFVGAALEPTQMKRLARGEVEAEKIRLKGQYEVEELDLQLAQRAAMRLGNQEMRRQANIEQVFEGALRMVPEETSEEPVDEDWISEFFGYCGSISNATMQAIWSRLLAGEISEPGTHTRRTLQIVSTMSQGDADLFVKVFAIQLNWGFDGEFQLHDFGVITTPEAEEWMIANRSVGGGGVQHLRDIGLLRAASPSPMYFQGRRELNLKYGERRKDLKIPDEYTRDSFPLISEVRLWGQPTLTGHQLHHALSIEPDYEYFEVLLKTLQAGGFETLPLGGTSKP